MSFYCPSWRILHLILATIVAVVPQDLSTKDLTDAKSPVPSSVFLPVSYEVRDADYLFLKEAGQDFMRNFSMQSHTQSFVILRASRQPAVNASYGPMSTEQLVPPDLVQSVRLFNAPDVFTFNWKIQAFVLTPRVFSTKPKVRVLFYVAGRDWAREEGAVDELPCVTVYAFWQTQEVRASCAMGGERGTCMAELLPLPGWFAQGSESTSRERQDPSAGNLVELYYQAQPKVSGKCNMLEGSRWGSSQQQQAEYVPVTPMQRIGSVRLLQIPKGMATLSRLKLGNSIVIRTSSKPLKKTDISTFYILMASSAQLSNFTLRATIKNGVTFRTATPSNSLLWDITLDTGADGAIAVTCQRKAPIPGKKLEGSLLEVLQMDFEVDELSSPVDSRVIIWKLELPSKNTAKTEGAMRIYTTQRDFIGLAPLITDTEILNTAVLTGKKVAVPVRIVAVEEDGLLTDVSEYTDCSSTDEDVLKVFSPLSDTILARTLVKVTDEKVTITELGVQMVAGLTMTLQLSPGSNRAILATTTTQEVLLLPKQEAMISAWVQFSDGSQTPLDIYDPAFYRVIVSSLDQGVVSVRGTPPYVVAEGEGEGVLVQVEMSICEACQKSKRKSIVAVGNGSLKVKFQVKSGWLDSITKSSDSSTAENKNNSADFRNDGEEMESDRKPSQDPSQRITASERDQSSLAKITTTIKSTEWTFMTSGSLGGVGKPSNSGSSPTSVVNISMMSSPGDSSKTYGSDNMIVDSVRFTSTVKGPGNLVNSNNFPTKIVAPGQETVEVEISGEEDMLANRPLTDLEIGMYALLGVFCLAIMVFLVNCISYVVKFRHKKSPSDSQEPTTGHRHDWVWLGTDAELVMNVPGSPIQQDSQTATTVIDIGPDKTTSLSRRPSCLASVTDSPISCVGSFRSKAMPTESLHSPTSKRKRVHFTTFSTLERQHLPHLPQRENGHGIHWVGKEDSCEEGPQVHTAEPLDHV
ncbi:transmembrane protein 132D isoform X2 [Dunckerocampus dactyliophorus]|uniref:transmembrane protein 132D isoform X2 n=1 Tax=Dunckerocampus dactyliophorus TaxID=161453 RepID=UPI0024064225|nr:transmembrane protein 132D isoform X2 [Dunckerocampus dactyliophorus]